MDTSAETRAITGWWLERAARASPRIDSNGDRVLFHGGPMLALGIAPIGLCVGLLLIYLAVPLTGPGNEPIWWVVITVFFLSAGICVLVERFGSRVTVTNEGILAEAWWPGHPKSVLWKDIASVDFGTVSQDLVVRCQDGYQLRVSTYFYGISCLVENIQGRLSPESYQKAKSFLDRVNDLTQMAARESAEMRDSPRAAAAHKWVKARTSLVRGLFGMTLAVGVALGGAYLGLDRGAVEVALGMFCFAAVDFISGGLRIWKSDRGLNRKLTWLGVSVLALVAVGAAAVQVDNRAVVPKSRNSEGLAHYERGQYDLAIADFDKAIESNPAYAAAYSNRGLSYLHKGEYDLAVGDLARAIELDPKNAVSHHNLGFAHNQKGKWDLAIPALSKALELDPQYARAYLDRALSSIGKGQTSSAIDDLNRALKFSRDPAVAVMAQEKLWQLLK